jgi:two-component system KDP operon response regulator KdpE
VPDRLLFIDNDLATAALTSYLQGKGFELIIASNAHEGLRQAYESRPHLVVLDVTLPDLDGRTVCARLRELCDVPIVMLSSHNAVDDIVAGLEAGADDYVARPCEPRELEARLRAVLRRFRSREEPRVLSYDDGLLRIDLRRQVVWRRGVPIHLSPTEFRLLASLLQHSGNVVSHEQLLTEVWGSPCKESLNYLSIYIRYIREKLEDDPKRPAYIQTKWGTGYRFVPRRILAPK